MTLLAFNPNHRLFEKHHQMLISCSMANHDTAKTPLLKGSSSSNHDVAVKCKQDYIINIKPPSIILHVLLAMVLYLGVGTICFVLIRGQLDGNKTNDLVDALYFCIVTMTTVGYGDLVPATPQAKLLSCLFVFSGMAIVGMILSKAADYLVEKNEALVARAFHLRDKAFNTAYILKEVETNRTKYKFMTASILLVLLVTLGTLFLTLYEELSFVDALYCVCATITTLGYGDESFATTRGRMFAVIWILTSTLCLAQFFFYLTELYTESKQKILLKRVLDRKLTFADIEAADLDNDNIVSAAEFIIMKLKEMEKITDEDICMLMECFRNLDVDESGTLTAADVISTPNSTDYRK